MKTPFDLISDIQRDNKSYLLAPDDQFVSFIVQRGLSMASPKTCFLLNETTNVLYGALDEQMMFDLLKLLVPKTTGYFKWIKKDAKAEKKDISSITLIKSLAIAMDRTTKDIEAMIDLDPDFLDQFKDQNPSIREKKK